MQDVGSIIFTTSIQISSVLYLNRWEPSAGLLHRDAQEKTTVNWTHDRVLTPASNKKSFIHGALTKKQLRTSQKRHCNSCKMFTHRIWKSIKNQHMSQKTNNSQPITFFSPKFSESKSKFLQSSPTVNRDRNNIGLLNIQSGLAWRSICIFRTIPTIYNIAGMLHWFPHLMITINECDIFWCVHWNVDVKYMASCLGSYTVDPGRTRLSSTMVWFHSYLTHTLTDFKFNKKYWNAICTDNKNDNKWKQLLI